MYTRQITNEETYTLSEAKQIIMTEQRHKKEKMFYYAKQKFLGLLSICAALVSYVVAKEEIDGFILLVMLIGGCFLALTKKRIID